MTREGRSGIAIMAPHGGGIEAGTSEIADAVAGADHAFYAFDGIKRLGNARLHIRSERFDEPRALALARTVEAVITVHGFLGAEGRILIGGRDRELRETVQSALRKAGFTADDGTAYGYAGLQETNLCNRGLGGTGVQLEFPIDLRRRLFHGLDRSGRQHPTLEFRSLVEAIRTGLAPVG